MISRWRFLFGVLGTVAVTLVDCFMNLAAFWRNQIAFEFVPRLHPLGDPFSRHDALPAFVPFPRPTQWALHLVWPKETRGVKI